MTQGIVDAAGKKGRPAGFDINAGSRGSNLIAYPAQLLKAARVIYFGIVRQATKVYSGGYGTNNVNNVAQNER